MVPKIIPAEAALVQSAQYLSSQIPARASKRLDVLKGSTKSLPGIDRLVERYDSLVRCPYPGYAHGQLRDMDLESAVRFGSWMDQSLQLLEQVSDMRFEYFGHARTQTN